MDYLYSLKVSLFIRLVEEDWNGSVCSLRVFIIHLFLFFKTYLVTECSFYLPLGLHVTRLVAPVNGTSAAG